MKEKTKYIKNAYVIDIDNYYLEENDHPIYRVKMNLERLVQDGKKLQYIIQPASMYRIYKVVTSESGEILDNTFINGNIYLKEHNIVEDELVMLYDSGKYYGPFIVAYRPIEGKYYVKTNADENNYLVQYFNESDVQRIELEKQVYNEAPTYSEFVYVNGEYSTYDAVTDEILLKEIPNEISLEMARINPEEFSVEPIDVSTFRVPGSIVGEGLGKVTVVDGVDPNRRVTTGSSAEEDDDERIDSCVVSVKKSDVIK